MESVSIRRNESLSHCQLSVLSQINSCDDPTGGGGGNPENKNRKLSHPLISTRDETFRGGKNVHVSSSLPRLSLISAVKWSGAVKIFAYRVTGASVFSRFDRSTTTTTTNRPRKKKKGGTSREMLEGRGGEREGDGYNRGTEVENRLI